MHDGVEQDDRVVDDGPALRTSVQSRDRRGGLRVAQLRLDAVHSAVFVAAVAAGVERVADLRAAIVDSAPDLDAELTGKVHTVARLLIPFQSPTDRHWFVAVVPVERQLEI